MKVIDIFGTIHNTRSTTPLLSEQIRTISMNCARFLDESDGQPVYKNLDRSLTFTKFKARTRKRNDDFSRTFSEALGENNLRQRAIYAHGGIQPIVESEESYYIFPTNQYKFVYNPQITDSTIYRNIYESCGNGIFTEALKHNYLNVNLNEAIGSGAEILFHGIPFCYAVNTRACDSYRDLLSKF